MPIPTVRSGPRSSGSRARSSRPICGDVFPRGRLSRGYRHLFPLPSAGGPCKRLHLFLRWMVRREAPDLGLWTSVSPARLLMPIDTHVENMSRALGLTRRRSRTWRWPRRSPRAWPRSIPPIP